jgi:hypothetical protein
LESRALAERLSAVVDGRHVQGNALATLMGISGEPVEEVRADAPALAIGMELNAGNVDLGEVILDDQEADLCAVGSDVISRSRLQVTAGQDMTSGVA